MENKTIEIPFGAKDSELKGWEYTIPENMEAEIKDGKIIVKQKENEDERIRKRLVEYFHEVYDKYTCLNSANLLWEGLEVKKVIAYLERQKDIEKRWLEDRDGCFWDGVQEGKKAAQEQKPAEWSEEDEEMFAAIIADIKFTQRAHNHEVNQVVYEREIDWLKSLRPQPKQEWSKEDEGALSYLHELISFGVDKKFFDAQTAADMRNWLNIRVESPHPAWKPSEEQPEEDLEKEIIRYQREDMDRDTTVRDVARHFYELGLNARKEECK